MQPSVLNNFRYRCRSMGYSSIKIKRLKECTSSGDYLYLVSAIEPLSKTEVRAVYTLDDFRRLCWYGKSSQKAFGEPEN